jgi:predicted nucleic acid-binding protein
MVLLDTNVLSEFMRTRPNPAVVRWLDAQAASEVFISAISRAEIELGLALMPSGKRQADLARMAQAMFDQDFQGQCLCFDDLSASHSARLVAARTHQGRPISVEDAQIAAIARARSLQLATRNTSDFVGIDGLSLRQPDLREFTLIPISSPDADWYAEKPSRFHSAPRRVLQ